MAFLHSEPVSEGVGLNCRIASFLGEKEWGGGKGGVGGGEWRPDGGEAEAELEGRRYYIIFRNKNTNFFSGQVVRSRSAGCQCQTSLKVYSQN